MIELRCRATPVPRRLRLLAAAIEARRPVAQLAANAGSVQHDQAAGTVLTVPAPPETFLFDLQGFIVLRGVLSPPEVGSLRARLYELEAADYPDVSARISVSAPPK
jgi:hypothetical protein